MAQWMSILGGDLTVLLISFARIPSSQWGRPDAEAQHLCSPTGTDRPAGMTGGEAAGGEGGCGGAGGGDAGAAMIAAGSTLAL